MARVWGFWLSAGIVVALGLLGWAMQVALVRSTPGSTGSTLSMNTCGCAALYALAGALGLEPQRRYSPAVEDLGPEVAQFWLIAPAEPLQPGEAEALLRWVSAGGMLVAVAKAPLIGMQGLTPTGTLDTIEPFLGADFVTIDLPPGVVADLQELPQLLPGLTLPQVGSQAPLGLRTYPVSPNHPLTQGIGPLPAVPTAASQGWSVGVFEPAAGAGAGAWEPLLASEVGTLLVRRRIGRGQILASTQPEWLANALLSAEAPRQLAARLLQARTRQGATVFSEFHHGRHGELRGWRSLWAVPWGRAVLWWGVVLLLAMLSAGWRFVAIPPMPTPAPPDPAAYPEALGRLYHRARALELIHYNLATFYRRQAHGSRGQPGRTEGRLRAAALARTLDPSGEVRTVRDLMRALRGADRQ
ncbi:MAG TPA: DUF4350 domain-containing protein [bacterium]|nr:DUF4350 domain-containing protein [bacterium]